MRGTVVIVWSRNIRMGITPAHAGNRPNPNAESCKIWDHPRSCGEQFWPPRFSSNFLRITPAHAGNSLQSYTLYGRVQDHPRSCGEQWRLSPYPAQVLGSPPLMRGTVCKIPQKRHRTGITPAHAGNSRLIYHHVERYGDHPRSCGEQPRIRRQRSSGSGSPPLMRGTVHICT